VLKALVVVAAVGLTIYCLFDVRSTAAALVRSLPKAAWFLVVLVPIVGPLAWFTVGRPARPGPGPARPPRRVVGPDDDPDFLWEIEKKRRRPRPPPPAPDA
jgi:hypothetical protein